MMSELLRGIGIGVGFVIGLILIVAVAAIIGAIIWKVYAMTLRRKFTADLFRSYSRDLLKRERFEELEKVKFIIKKLENREQPKEMLKAYEVSVYSDLEWIPLPDGGERLIFRRDRKIIKKSKN